MMILRQPAELQRYHLGACFESVGVVDLISEAPWTGHVGAAEDARKSKDVRTWPEQFKIPPIPPTCMTQPSQRVSTRKGDQGRGKTGHGHSALCHHDLLAISLMYKARYLNLLSSTFRTLLLASHVSRVRLLGRVSWWRKV